MKNSKIFCVWGIICVVILVVGIWVRMGMKNQYDNGVESEGMQEMKVAQIKESYVEILNNLPQQTSRASIILLVESTGQMDFEGETTKQEAVLVRVIKGVTGASIGEKIYIAGQGVRSKDGDLRMQFTNFMKKGKQYLVFLDGESDSPLWEDKGKRIFSLTEEMVMFRTMCLEDFEVECIFDERCDADGYVKYKYLKDNEFFATSENVVDMVREMKQKIFKKYLQVDK